MPLKSLSSNRSISVSDIRRKCSILKMTSAPVSVGSISKPMLKGLHNATIKKNLMVALGLVVVITSAYKVLVNDPKKAKYAEFYKTYDAQKSFEKMKAAGVFQSC